MHDQLRTGSAACRPSCSSTVCRTGERSTEQAARSEVPSGCAPRQPRLYSAAAGLHQASGKPCPARLRERDVPAPDDGARSVRARVGRVLAQERQRALQRVRRLERGRHPDLAPLLHRALGRAPAWPRRARAFLMHACRRQLLEPYRFSLQHPSPHDCNRSAGTAPCHSAQSEPQRLVACAACTM